MPPIRDADKQFATMELLMDDEFSKMFRFDGGRVTMSPRFQELIQEGKLCPAGSKFSFHFITTSDKLGSGRLAFDIEILTQPNSGITFFKFDVPIEEIYEKAAGLKWEPPSLKIIKIDRFAVMTIEFSDLMLVPADLSKLSAFEFET